MTGQSAPIDDPDETIALRRRGTPAAVGRRAAQPLRPDHAATRSPEGGSADDRRRRRRLRRFTSRPAVGVSGGRAARLRGGGGVRLDERRAARRGASATCRRRRPAGARDTGGDVVRGRARRPRRRPGPGLSGCGPPGGRQPRHLEPSSCRSGVRQRGMCPPGGVPVRGGPSPAIACGSHRPRGRAGHQPRPDGDAVAVSAAASRRARPLECAAPGRAC